MQYDLGSCSKYFTVANYEFQILVYQPPSPTTMEMASLRRDSVPEAMAWQGLVMIHAQASLKTMWERYGFAEELRNEKGEVEIGREPHWIEEGIEHLGMWRRLRIDNSRS